MKQEDMTTKQRRKNFEARPLWEENRIDFHLEGFTLFIDGGEAKPSPIEIPNPQKIDQYPKILGQSNQEDVNRRCHTISVIMVSGFEETPVISFKNSN